VGLGTVGMNLASGTLIVKGEGSSVCWRWKCSGDGALVDEFKEV